MSGDAWIGLLFWLAILCYATGSGLVDSAVTSSGQAAGAVLMLGNSAIVVAIAVLLIPVVRRESEAAAWGYFAARLAEALLLALGVVFALTRLSVDEAGLAAALGAAQFFSYQVAMLALGLGSLPMCAALLRGGLLPAWLSIWGLAGYTALGAGAVAELFGQPVGLEGSLLGGLFELALPLWLCTQGFSQSALLEE